MSPTSKREQRVRVQSALASAGQYDAAEFVARREEYLDGTVHSDLEMAVNVTVAVGGLVEDRDVAHVAELGLDGRLGPVRALVQHVESARDSGAHAVVVAEAAAAEAATVAGIEVRSAQHLSEVLDGQTVRVEHVPPTFRQSAPEVPALGCWGLPLVEELAQLDPAASCVLLVPARRGVGSTLLARALRSQLAPPSTSALADLARAQSAAGIWREPPYLERPFRAPHHTCSAKGLVGDRWPGEVELARHGVLLLDEVEEFSALALSETVRAVREERGAHGSEAALVVAVAAPEHQDGKRAALVRDVLAPLGPRVVRLG